MEQASNDGSRVQTRLQIQGDIDCNIPSSGRSEFYNYKAVTSVVQESSTRAKHELGTRAFQMTIVSFAIPLARNKAAMANRVDLELD